MSVRKSLVVAASALAAVAFAMPAHAEEGIGVSTTFAGLIISMSEDLTPNSENTVGAEQVAGWCRVTGQTSLNGATMRYEFGGEAVASSTSQSQPEVTSIQCELISPAQGIPGERPTLSAKSPSAACPGPVCNTGSVETHCPGPVCVSGDVVVSGWPVRPVKACITGFAVFGPTPVVQADIIPACSVSTL